jgi:hypothetical protein
VDFGVRGLDFVVDGPGKIGPKNVTHLEVKGPVSSEIKKTGE